MITSTAKQLLAGRSANSNADSVMSRHFRIAFVLRMNTCGPIALPSIPSAALPKLQRNY